MLKGLMKSVGKKFLGDNILLRQFAGSYASRGRYFSAALFTLYAIPLRNILKYGRGIFIASENYYRELHGLLKIDSVDGFGLVRIGRDHDGGYIMLDDLPGGTAYSFGISNDVSWDKDMALKGYDVFMYDHTIDRLPEEDSHFHWSKIGLSDGITQDKRLKTLEELISSNGHEGKQNMILKMDVEGAEWGFLEKVKSETLAQFSQMTFEIHGITNPIHAEHALKVLRKINATHQLIHLHANNFGDYVSAGGKNFCTLFEVSYVLRDKYKFSSSYDPCLPLEIDMPNLTRYPEIRLGFWNREPEFDGHMFCTTRYPLQTEK